HLGVIGCGVVGLTTALQLLERFPNAETTIENTTSYVAAGIFRPGTSFMGLSEEITKQWIADAFHYWDDIRQHLFPVYRLAAEDELKLCQGDWKCGSFFTPCVTESRSFLPYAAQKFTNAGGFGAKQLCIDNHLVPIRGHVTLGGCRQFDSYNTEICSYNFVAVKKLCCNML
uniref:FAD dependent oxidoreductase domain-containing protein n=1 Tax=Glossina palpalis gambiensis TaxID=67801 RepID=A0A1B0C3C3_9MUSC